MHLINKIKKSIKPFYIKKNLLLVSVLRLITLSLVAMASYLIFQLQHSLISDEVTSYWIISRIFIFIFFMVSSVLDLFFQYIRIKFRSNRSFIVVQSIIQTIIIYGGLSLYIDHLVGDKSYFLTYIFVNYMFYIFVFLCFLITILYNILMHLVRHSGENLFDYISVNSLKDRSSSKKIVMFMDITDSTKHVLRLGNSGYTEFIKDFFL